MNAAFPNTRYYSATRVQSSDGPGSLFLRRAHGWGEEGGFSNPPHGTSTDENRRPITLETWMMFSRIVPL